MKRQTFYHLFLLYSLIIAVGCSTSSQIYKSNDPKKASSGQLSDSTFAALKHFLTITTGSILNDTIIIKYDYNNETCWSLLNKSPDEQIMVVVTSKQERITQILKTRQNVSVFRFREPGNNISKVIKWDNLIRIDSSGQLLNLLFKDRSTCGSSILVMPDKRFVYLRSDAHSEIFELATEQIELILNKK